MRTQNIKSQVSGGIEARSNPQAVRPQQPVQQLVKSGRVGTPAKATTAPEGGEQPVKRRQRVRPETRAQMLERLMNPLISLHEASVLLKVCPATVRRYTDSGLLPHARTPGGQRRFYLRDVLALYRQMEAKRR